MELSKYSAFVDYIFKRIESDKGFRADLRHADNPSFEWKIWPTIMRFEDSVDNPSIRRAYAIISAAAAKSKQKNNGTVGLGQAMKEIESEKNSADYISLRFKRIIAAESLDELLLVMPSTLALFSSEGISFDYGGLLNDLVHFRSETKREQVKMKWAKSYFQVETKNGEPSNVSV